MGSRGHPHPRPPRPPPPPPQTPGGMRPVEHQPYYSNKGIIPGGWGLQCGGRNPTEPPPEMGLAAPGLPNASIHTSTADLQEVTEMGAGAALPSPSPAAPTTKVATLSLLHLFFVCGVTGDGGLPPIWEAVARGRGSMEGLENLNQTLMWVLPSCCRLFGGRDHFSAPPLPAIVHEEG